MKRDVVNQLVKASQIAWEKYVTLPTNENRELFEKIDDELRVELEFDRTKCDSCYICDNNDIACNNCSC